MSIHSLLVLNRQGKTRVARWYNSPLSESEKQEYISDVHRLISGRDLKHQLNFVEFREHKLVYRRYAGLYFVVLIDYVDNELSYLELVHFLVEILDIYFNNVCELDLVFNFYKLYIVLDEIYLGGELQETLRDKVLLRLAYLDGLAS